MGLYKPTFKRDEQAYRSPNWTYTFRHPGTGRRVKGSTGTADRKAAETLYRDAMRQAALEKAGLVSRHNADYKRSILKHLDDYERSLRDTERTAGYVATTIPRVRRVIEGCGFRRWSDLSKDRLETFLARLRREGAGTRTRNFYLRAFKQFLNWMVDHDRADSNPLTRVQSLKVTDEDRRRAPLPGELQRLIDAALAGPDVLTVPGSERAMLYLMAAATGFRFNECRALTWEHLDVDGEHPAVALSASESKHREEDHQPLADDAAAELRWWRGQEGSLESSQRLFPHVQVWHQGSKLLRPDLEAAGIPFRGAKGRRIVFHSLRDYYITYVRRGSDAKTGQELARHVDPQLTAKYSHEIPADMYAAVNRMPKIGVRSRRPQPGAA